jgi:hypothetical protein
LGTEALSIIEALISSKQMAAEGGPQLVGAKQLLSIPLPFASTQLQQQQQQQQQHWQTSSTAAEARQHPILVGWPGGGWYVCM